MIFTKKFKFGDCCAVKTLSGHVIGSPNDMSLGAGLSINSANQRLGNICIVYLWMLEHKFAFVTHQRSINDIIKVI